MLIATSMVEVMILSEAYPPAYPSSAKDPLQKGFMKLLHACGWQASAFCFVFFSAFYGVSGSVALHRNSSFVYLSFANPLAGSEILTMPEFTILQSLFWDTRPSAERTSLNVV
jgi:hypothetical protein